MIYRIRIMRLENGVLVFDRYATDEEIFGGDILVAPDGNVYEWVNIPVPESDPMYKFGGYTQEWKRSDTHFVEWGEDVDALRSRIEELEKQTIVWHKYPDEKPERPIGTLIPAPVTVLSMLICYKTVDGNEYVTEDLYHWYDNLPHQFGIECENITVTRWAYQPEPPREEGND